MDRKEQAHKRLTAFHNVCDLYNEGKLDDDTEGITLLKVYQDIAKEAKGTLVELYRAAPCETTEQYMIFVAKILVRLSYLIHEGRRETDLERYDHINLVTKKYGISSSKREEQ